MSVAVTRLQREQLARDNLQYGEHLQEVPSGRAFSSSDGSHGPMRVWRSRQFLVVLWLEKTGFTRLTCQRSKVNPDGSWVEGISWDDMQRLKSEAGFGHLWAVECFPPDSEVVNVANLRHMFLLNEPPAFGWHKKATA